MPTDKRYLLDANVFIEAKRRYYAFDLCPGYWECLVWHHRAASIQSVDRVKVELERGADELQEPRRCRAPTPIPTWLRLAHTHRYTESFSRRSTAKWRAKTGHYFLRRNKEAR